MAISSRASATALHQGAASLVEPDSSSIQMMSPLPLQIGSRRRYCFSPFFWTFRKKSGRVSGAASMANSEPSARLISPPSSTVYF